MLRTRLISGLLCLLVILLSMGLYSIDRCSDLGKRISIFIEDNDKAGRSMRQMKRSNADMTSALLTLVTGDQEKSRANFRSAGQSFQKALDEETSRKSASPEEKALINQLATLYPNYVTEADTLMRSAYQADAPGRAAAARLGQETSQILDLLDQLYTAHQHSVTESDHTSATEINMTIRSLILLMIAAVVVFLYASMRLSRGLLEPLTSLASSIRQVGAGNLDQSVPVLSGDELGVLATSFNQMAAQLRNYKAATSEELMRLTLTIRSTLASFPDPIFVLRSEGVVEFRNPAADQLALKLLFAGVTRLPPKVDQKVDEVIASGKDYLPTSLEGAINFYVDGQDRYYLPRIVLLRDDLQNVFGVAVILEDVTRMLLLDDVKSNLIATVSHELKTPMTTVRMAIYLLHEKTVGPLNEKQMDLVATAREDADRLLKTLNDLLDLAKLEQGPSQLHLDRVSPADLIEGVLHDTREITQRAGLKVKTAIAPGLPDVHIDRQRMVYVLTNLITNATKYSPNDTDLIVGATLGQTRANAPGVRISVKDQGTGISPHNQEHIFERFYRVPGTTQSGVGLGLSIAREIVVAHGGEIGVISQLGQGSEFFFILPIPPETESHSTPVR